MTANKPVKLLFKLSKSPVHTNTKCDRFKLTIRMNKSVWYLLFIAVVSQYCSNGLKCELKSLVNNKIRCMLHGTLSTISAATNQSSKFDKRGGGQLMDAWKYSTGLDCNKSFYSGNVLEDFKSRLRDWIPGSKWCGDVVDGAALTSEDLDLFVKTDNCCRRHESCPFAIKPKDKANSFGLTNDCVLPRFACECEHEFLGCLKNANGWISNKIGQTYFSIVGPQCFRNASPIVKCRRTIRRCVEYEYNKTGTHKYQWFDGPLY